MLSIVDKIDLPSGRNDVQIIMAETKKKENIKNNFLLNDLTGLTIYQIKPATTLIRFRASYGVWSVWLVGFMSNTIYGYSQQRRKCKVQTTERYC